MITQAEENPVMREDRGEGGRGGEDDKLGRSKYGKLRKERSTAEDKERNEWKRKLRRKEGLEKERQRGRKERRGNGWKRKERKKGGMDSRMGRRRKERWEERMEE